MIANKLAEIRGENYMKNISEWMRSVRLYTGRCDAYPEVCPLVGEEVFERVASVCYGRMPLLTSQIGLRGE